MAERMKCSKCGRALLESDTACDQCGTPVASCSRRSDEADPPLRSGYCDASPPHHVGGYSACEPEEEKKMGSGVQVQTGDAGYQEIHVSHTTHQAPEQPIRCQFKGGCVREIVMSARFICRRCEAPMCHAHKDSEFPEYCEVCAEYVRRKQSETGRGKDAMEEHRRAAGGPTAGQAITCQYMDCREKIAPDERFTCARCGRVLCRRHQDDDHLDHCKICAQRARTQNFAAECKDIGARPHDESYAVSQSNPPFKAVIWPSRGFTTRDINDVSCDNKDVFRIGEEIYVNAQSERDAYLTLIDFGTSGKTCVLCLDYYLPSGPVQMISSPTKGNWWQVGAPAGVEKVGGFFTEQRLGKPGEDHKSLSVEEVWRRVGEMPRDSWTDASCEFVIKG